MRRFVHNHEVLGADFGPFAEEITDLRARQILGERPALM
jgi:hypothetical protein